jgi:hypothetical protein
MGRCQPLSKRLEEENPPGNRGVERIDATP